MTEPTPPARLLAAAAERVLQPDGPAGLAEPLAALLAYAARYSALAADLGGEPERDRHTLHAVALARAILTPATAPHGPQERPADPGAGKETPDARSGRETGTEGRAWLDTLPEAEPEEPTITAVGDGEVILRIPSPTSMDTEAGLWAIHIGLDAGALPGLRDAIGAHLGAADSVAHAIETQLSATPGQAAQAGEAARQVFGQPPTGLRDRIAAAIAHLADTGGIYAIDEPEIDRASDAVMAVVERWAAQLAAGRETARRKAREIERDRNRLADELTAATARADRAEAEVERLTRLVAEYADRAIANGERADRAETHRPA